MTTERRLERDLPTIIGAIAMGPYPDYIDDVLATTAQRRQRPRWTFPERWLPMAVVTRRPVIAPTVPWRTIGVLALIAILIAAALAVYVGSQTRVPAPFGPARNGLITYEADGDIYIADPVTGIATAMVSGPETDVGPRFSRDGTHVVFERRLEGDLSQLFVVGSDGSDLTAVTPEPVQLTKSVGGEPWEQYQFSPDGQSVLIASTDGGVPGISIAKSDGSGVNRLETVIYPYEPSFRPPDGAEILFVGPDHKAGLTGSGVFVVDPSSGVVRTIIGPSPTYDFAGANWSPDGSQIAYWRWGGPGSDLGLTAHTRIVSADGTGDRELPAPADAVWNAGSEWSNDGTRLFVLRGYTPGLEDVRGVVIPVDGSSPGVEIRHDGLNNMECCATWEWAPDDTKILGTPTNAAGQPLRQVILDPVTGETRVAPWTSLSDPSWQRLAP